MFYLMRNIALFSVLQYSLIQSQYDKNIIEIFACAFFNPVRAREVTIIPTWIFNPISSCEVTEIPTVQCTSIFKLITAWKVTVL